MIRATRDNGEDPLRRELVSGLAAARVQTDELFSLVRAHALLDRPIRERHRILFYLGHLEAFDGNLILRDSLGRTPANEVFDRLFAFGIDPVGGELPDDEPGDWPSVAEVLSYDRGIREALDAALAEISLDRPASPNLEAGWAVRLAIEHRLMHAETLTYMLQELPYEAKKPGPAPGPAGETPPRRLVEIPAGRATLGLARRSAPERGWDNE
ncbi:MAG TPA: DinB family protein, partial [Vicinamibacteria bacterium]